MSYPDFRFSVFLPSVVVCACVCVATQRLKLVDAAVSSETVMNFLANLLAIDLVRLMFNWHFQIISLLTLSCGQHRLVCVYFS